MDSETSIAKEECAMNFYMWQLLITSFPLAKEIVLCGIALLISLKLALSYPLNKAEERNTANGRNSWYLWNYSFTVLETVKKSFSLCILLCLLFWKKKAATSHPESPLRSSISGCYEFALEMRQRQEVEKNPLQVGGKERALLRGRISGFPSLQVYY